MGKSIRTFLALAVISASLAFSFYGVARAASGFVANVMPRLSHPFVSLADMSQTAEPPATVEASATAEPTEMTETETPEHSVSGTGKSEPEELDDDNSQGSNFQGDDSDEMFGTPQPGMSEHHHSGSGGSGSGSWGDDDGGGD